MLKKKTTKKNTKIQKDNWIKISLFNYFYLTNILTIIKYYKKLSMKNNHFRRLKKLGSGNYGDVLLMEHQLDKTVLYFYL